MSTPITIEGKQYVSQPSRGACKGCVAQDKFYLCNALPGCVGLIFVEHKEEMKMKTPHKHAELIKAWADGAEVEMKTYSTWTLLSNPRWDSDSAEYRIKPKPDVVYFQQVSLLCDSSTFVSGLMKHKTMAVNMRITFDGETGKLKSAEVI